MVRTILNIVIKIKYRQIDSHKKPQQKTEFKLKTSNWNNSHKYENCVTRFKTEQKMCTVKSVTYKENYKLVQTISKFIVTEYMVNMIRNVVWGRCNQSGKRNFL